jgi:hypothetical protein
VSSPRPNVAGDANVIICMPVRDRIEPETEFALRNNIGFAHRLLTEIGFPVDVARNRLTARALASDAEHVVWIDADAFWQRGCLERVLSWMTDPMRVVGAVFGKRVHFSTVTAQAVGGGPMSLERIREADTILPCHFIGAHVLACTRVLLERLGPNPWSLESQDKSEDVAFARRVREAGCGLYLDTRAWSFHVENGVMYVPGSPAYVLAGGNAEPRPLPPTPPFPRRRAYGAAVDDARRNVDNPFESAGADRNGVLARLKSDIETKPGVAERFRLPTEDELANLFGDS